MKALARKLPSSTNTISAFFLQSWSLADNCTFLSNSIRRVSIITWNSLLRHSLKSEILRNKFDSYSDSLPEPSVFTCPILYCTVRTTCFLENHYLKPSVCQIFTLYYLGHWLITFVFLFQGIYEFRIQDYFICKWQIIIILPSYGMIRTAMFCHREQIYLHGLILDHGKRTWAIAWYGNRKSLKSKWFKVSYT